MRIPRFFRPTLLAAACVLAVSAMTAGAQENRLPDMGSSAASQLSPAQQREYGAMMLAQLRHYEMTLDDPLVNDWLQGVGRQLAASSDRPDHGFTFFMLKDRQINAFATLGGYIGMNAGLVMNARSEDEVAGVLSHEIAHVTQSHVLRAVERARRDSVPILLGMLAAVMVAQKAGGGGNSATNATMAAIMSAQGLMVQRQIDYTRSNESEADRLGIRTLARSGYEPTAMAAFFERMLAATRTNRGGDTFMQTPDYLMTHPVTTTRIAEAKSRAGQLDRAVTSATGTASDNPLLPGGLRLGIATQRGASGQFLWARERLRVLSATTPRIAIGEYEAMARQAPLDDAQKYGLAFARLRDGRATEAVVELKPLVEKNPADAWLSMTLAEAESRAGQIASADARFEALQKRLPHSRPLAITWARVLVERNTPAAGKQAQTVLRPLLSTSATDPDFQLTFARANEVAGDPVRAGEAYAEAAFLNGNPERALLQLNTLKQRPDLDYYARARIDARITAITPMVLELQRQGLGEDQQNGRS